MTTDPYAIQMVRDAMQWVAFALDILAVLVIVGSLLVATARSGLLRAIVRADATGPGELFKRKLLGGILLGVDLLVASDVIKTAALEATLRNMATLGLLVVIRILLSWSLFVEVEGRWPWQAPPAAGDGDAAAPPRTSATST